MVLVFIRHGQTTGDVEDRYGGDYEDHLTALGREQANAAADKLTDLGIKKLYTSPMIRAMETASIVAQKLKMLPEIKKEFRERNSYGILSGMTKTEAAQKHPEQVALAQDTHNTLEGGEDYLLFSRRIIGGLHSLMKNPADVLAVVTHGGPLRFIFRDILHKGEIELDDCALAILEAKNGSLNLIKTSGIRSLSKL